MKVQSTAGKQIHHSGKENKKPTKCKRLFQSALLFRSNKVAACDHWVALAGQFYGKDADEDDL